MQKTLVALSLFAIASSSIAKPLTVPATRLSALQQYYHLMSASGTQVIVNQQQIQQSGADNLTELLQNISGIHIYYSNNPQSPSITMRGFGANGGTNVVFLVNGFPLQSPDISTDFYNLIPISQIKRIQILPQSASVLYGSGAVGGVINIITKTPQHFQAGASIGMGSYRANKQSVHISDKHGHFYYGINARKLRTDNNRAHNNFNQTTGQLNVGYQGQQTSVDVNYINDYENEQYPGTASKSSKTDFGIAHTNNVFLHLKHRFDTNWHLDGHLQYRIDDGEGFYQSAGSFKQHRYILNMSPKLIGHLQQDNIITINGLQLQHSRYQSDFYNSISNSNNNTTAAFTHWHIPLNPTYALVLGANWGKQSADLNGQQGNNHAFITEQSLIAKPNHHWRLYLRRSGSYRFPRVDEANTSGKLLQTQTGTAYEGGLDWQNTQWQVQAEAYLIDLNNEIAYAAVDPNHPTSQQNRNLDPTKRLGILLHSHYRINPQYTIYADINMVNATYRRGPFTGKRIPLVSERTAKLGFSDQLSTQWLWYIDSVYSGGFYADGDDANQHYLGGYTLFNTHISYQLQQWTISLRVNNLLNKQYSTYVIFSPFSSLLGSYPAAGRNYWLDISYDCH